MDFSKAIDTINQGLLLKIFDNFNKDSLKNNHKSLKN